MTQDNLCIVMGLTSAEVNNSASLDILNDLGETNMFRNGYFSYLVFFIVLFTSFLFYFYDIISHLDCL